VRAQWYGIDGEIDSVVSKVYLVLNSNEKLYLTEYTSYVNGTEQTDSLLFCNLTLFFACNFDDYCLYLSYIFYILMHFIYIT